MAEPKNTRRQTSARPETLRSAAIRRRASSQSSPRPHQLGGVEKKPKRACGEGGARVVGPTCSAQVARPAQPARRPRLPRAAPRRAANGVVAWILRTLTEEKRSARASALADSRVVREVEERRHCREEAARRVAREAAEPHRA